MENYSSGRKPRIIFIAGPYFGDGERKTIEKNIRTAEQYQIALANVGVPFFCAHNHTEHFEEKADAPEEFYTALDFEILKRACDGILVISGWETSRGTQAEVAWARETNFPIFFPKSPDDLGEVIAFGKKRN